MRGQAPLQRGLGSERGLGSGITIFTVFVAKARYLLFDLVMAERRGSLKSFLVTMPSFMSRGTLGYL